MNSYIVKFGFFTTASLLAIAYAPGTSCKDDKQQEEKVKQEAKPQANDVDSVDSWDDIFTQMHENFGKMQQRVEEDLKTAKNRISTIFDKTPITSLSMATDDKSIIITLGNVRSENIDATTHDNERLTVKTPDVTLEIAIHDNVLHAQVTQEQKSEEDKDGAKKQFASMNYAESYQTIAHELDLDNAKVQFEEKDKSLVITIPYLPEKADKKLTVEKVNTQQPTQEK